jgi:ribonuclease P protein component
VVSLGFSKRLRLLKKADFDAVFAARASSSDGMLLVYGARNTLGHPRLGLAVSRKVGNAVARNRWKRLIREAFRLAQHELPPLDLVVLPRTATPNFLAIDRSLRSMVARLNRRLEAP